MTHPYPQKELLDALNTRAGRPIATAFVTSLLMEHRRDPELFAKSSVDRIGTAITG